MLDEFGTELDATDSKLDTTMKRIAKVLHITNGNNNPPILKELLSNCFCRSSAVDSNCSFIRYSYHCDNFIYLSVIFLNSSSWPYATGYFT